MLYLDGKPLKYDIPFTHEDTQYPATWLRNATLEEKEAIGITEVANTVEPYYDQRFYWGADNPKDHEELQTLWLSNTRQTAKQMLSNTDWCIVRFIDTGDAIPDEVRTERELVRTRSDDKETAILATADTDDLATYIKSVDYSTWGPYVSNELPDELPPPDETLDLEEDQ